MLQVTSTAWSSKAADLGYSAFRWDGWATCDVALLMEQVAKGARFENVPMDPISGKAAIRASALGFMEQIESAPRILISVGLGLICKADRAKRREATFDSSWRLCGQS